MTSTKEGDLHESLEIDYAHCDLASSDGSDISEMGGSNPVGDKQREEVVGSHSHSSSKYQINNCLVGFAHEPVEHNTPRNEGLCQRSPNSKDGTKLGITFPTGEDSECGEARRSSRAVNGKKSLEGVRILLAEDTPVI